jgi:hypothetical protein
MKTYKSKGYVLGNLWGGGVGAYPAEKLEASTKAGLIKKAEKMLADGSLDSGMGYESLIGAILDIETVEQIEKYGKAYFRSEFDWHFIGKLTEEQKNFLDDCINNL